MTSKPQISCIMAVYNTEEEYLRDAIESVLQQSFATFEFIIVDDCSDNRTLNILNSYTDPRIVYVRNDNNLGLTASLNKGIKIALGDYIARIDSDDICDIKRFEQQYRYMEANPDVAVLGTIAMLFGDEKGIFGIHSENSDEIEALLFFGNIINHSSVFIRKEFLKKNNLLYDENIKKSQDYDLWVRIIRRGKIRILPQHLLQYRIHHAQISHRTHSEQLQYANTIKIRQVNELVGDLDKHERESHFAICDGRVFSNYRDTVLWVQKLISANREKRLIKPFFFENVIMTLLMVALIKHVIRHKEILIFKDLTIWKMLNPYYYYGYMKYTFRYISYAFYRKMR